MVEPLPLTEKIYWDMLIFCLFLLAISSAFYLSILFLKSKLLDSFYCNFSSSKKELDESKNDVDKPEDTYFEK